MLFLLSYDLWKIETDADPALKLILMTATMDTPIFAAVLMAVRRLFPSLGHANHIEVEHPNKDLNPATRTVPLERITSLPEDFWTKMRMPQQTAWCIDAMLHWSHERGQPAAILVLVAGEAEMDQVLSGVFCSVPFRSVPKG